MKQKTKKSVAKRVRITRTGKVLRRISFARHLRRKKSAAQKRRYAQKALITGRVAKRYKRLMAKA